MGHLTRFVIALAITSVSVGCDKTRDAAPEKAEQSKDTETEPAAEPTSGAAAEAGTAKVEARPKPEICCCESEGDAVHYTLIEADECRGPEYRGRCPGDEDALHDRSECGSQCCCTSGDPAQHRWMDPERCYAAGTSGKCDIDFLCGDRPTEN